MWNNPGNHVNIKAFSGSVDKIYLLYLIIESPKLAWVAPIWQKYAKERTYVNKNTN